LSYLYEEKDGYRITKELGDVDYYKNKLRYIVDHYGLSKPDYEELQQIGKKIYDYMHTMKFRAALPSPKHPHISFWYRLLHIAESISNISQENLNTEDSYKKFCLELLEALDDAEHDLFWEERTR
jgi:hypothetical protein